MPYNPPVGGSFNGSFSGTGTFVTNNAGYISWTAPSPSSVSGAFQFTSQLFAGVNADGSDNFVWNMGINVSSNGTRQDVTKPMLRTGYEANWGPTGYSNLKFVEYHISTMGSDGVEKRPYSGMYAVDGTLGSCSMQASQLAFKDWVGTGTQKVLFDFVNNVITTTGQTITFSQNNVAVLSMRNAANNAFISLPFINASNQMDVTSAQLLIHPTLGLTSSGDIIVTPANNSSRFKIRSGTNNMGMEIYKTYTDASNYGRLTIYNPGSTNPFKITTEFIGTSAADANQQLQFECPGVYFINRAAATTANTVEFYSIASQTGHLTAWRNTSNALAMWVPVAGNKLVIGTNLSSNCLDLFAGASGTIANFQSNSVAANDNLFTITTGNAVTGGYNMLNLVANGSGSVSIYQQQNGAGPNQLYLLNVGAGNIQCRYEVNGGTTYTHGINRSDSNNFCISASNTLGTSNVLRLTTGGLIQSYGAKQEQTTTLTTGTTLNTTTHRVILCDATSAAFTVTLPTAVGFNGLVYDIIKVDSSANAITIATTSAQTINGSATKSLATQYSTIRVRSNNANWLQV